MLAVTAAVERVEQALRRLEEALRDSEHPLLSALQPGLDADAIAAMEPTGLRFPEEAAALWRWRNGVAPAFTSDPTRVPDSEMLPGGCLFLPLEAAVRSYLSHRHTFPWEDRNDLLPA